MNTSPQDLQDITVKVPTHRIASFYRMYGRWLDSEDAAEAAEPNHEDNERRPWDPGKDLKLAKEAWGLFPERAQHLFGTLIDNPGQKFSGEQLAKLHDIPNGVYGVAGVLAWPGRYLIKLNRDLHFKVGPNPEGGSSYWMEPAMADLFRQARDAA